jgi:hypothetical protein
MSGCFLKWKCAAKHVGKSARKHIEANCHRFVIPDRSEVERSAVSPVAHSIHRERPKEANSTKRAAGASARAASTILPTPEA